MQYKSLEIMSRRFDAYEFHMYEEKNCGKTVAVEIGDTVGDMGRLRDMILPGIPADFRSIVV